MSQIMFSHQKRVKKAFFLSELPKGGLVLPNKSQLSNLQNRHTEMHFWPLTTGHVPPFFQPLRKTTGYRDVRNHVFSSEEGLKSLFLYLTSPKGVLFCQIRVSCQTFKMVIQRCFFLTPHFWPFKNHWTCQKSCFLIRRELKNLFFYPTSPKGVLFCQNKSQLSNLQNGHTEMIFLNPHFWPFKNHWTCQKSCFLIRREFKKAFFLSNPPGVLFCQNKSQLSNLQNGHVEMLFLTPHFWPFKNHWTCQKSCFLIRSGFQKKNFFSIWPHPRSLALPK